MPGPGYPPVTTTSSMGSAADPSCATTGQVDKDASHKASSAETRGDTFMCAQSSKAAGARTRTRASTPTGGLVAEMLVQAQPVQRRDGKIRQQSQTTFELAAH